MWPTKEDFRLEGRNFDLTNGLNILRIICGLFLFPHVLGKFAAGTASAATVGFLPKPGFTRRNCGSTLQRLRKLR